MAKQDIRLMGDPVLREVAEDIPVGEIQSKEIQALIEDLEDSMHHYGGIGIAAPQIGISKKIAIIDAQLADGDESEEDDEDALFVIINPKLKVLDETPQGFWEGCLSVPGLRGYVERPRKLEIEFYNENAEKESIIVEDFLATVFQHELDHLFGTLYVDRIKDMKKLVYEETMQSEEDEQK